ncbi:MAG: Flp family type IVb pilin [Hyphomicrobiaceae bacterium]
MPPVTTQIAKRPSRVSTLIANWRTNTKGSTAIEYSLIAALIAIGIIGGVTNLAGSATTGWNGIANKAGNAMK